MSAQSSVTVTGTGVAVGAVTGGSGVMTTAGFGSGERLSGGTGTAVAVERAPEPGIASRDTINPTAGNLAITFTSLAHDIRESQADMRILCALVLMVLVANPAFATFSIVAFDPVTGDLGVAVASRVFGVGNHVPSAEAGVGAVATQAAMNGGYGPRGLDLLRQGLTAQQVIDRLLAEDAFDRKEGRQVAVVDAKRNVAVYNSAG